MAGKIDAIDIKIMKELQVDANQPLEALAKKVGASKTPVWNRIRKLRDAGIIKTTVADLDHVHGRDQGHHRFADLTR